MRLCYAGRHDELIKDHADDIADIECGGAAIGCRITAEQCRAGDVSRDRTEIQRKIVPGNAIAVAIEGNPVDVGDRSCDGQGVLGGKFKTICR